MDIIILGGTFDPPHLGHKEILDSLDIKADKIIIMPNKVPPHKPCFTAPGHRLNMCKLTFPGHEISRLELEAKEPSYTHLTLAALRQNLTSKDKIYYIIGADSMRDLHTWKRPDLLASLAAFVVIPRDNLPAQQYINDFRRSFGGEFILNSKGVADISSSEIRLLAAFSQLQGVVVPEVAQYIEQHKLYDSYRKIVERYYEFGLSEHRIEHIKNAALTAIKLAKAHGADVDKATTAALLHDVAKRLDPETALRYGIKLPEKVKNSWPVACRHAALGAVLAQKEFGINDNEIIEAIRFHTTGRAAMGTIEKIIFIADYIEPGREFDGLEPIRRAAYEDLDKCIKLILEQSIRRLLLKGKEPTAETYEALKYYSHKTTEDQNGN